MTIQQAFELAFQRQQSGRLAEAEAIYRQILAVNPRHADALHRLGIIAHQVGRNEIAVDLIRQSIAAAPNVPDFHSNLGEVYRALGQLDDAIASYRKAIALKPDYPEAYSNLGVALKGKGQLDEVISVCRQAIALKPNFAEAYHNLGNALCDQARLDEAIAAQRQAIVLKPDFVEAHSNLGIALIQKGQVDEAIVALHQAILLRPGFPEAFCNLGIALDRKGRRVEAIDAYNRAIALNPSFAEAHSNLGIALFHDGRLNEAIAAFRMAVALKPISPEVLSNLGNALRDNGQLEEAVESFRQAIALQPDSAGVQSNLGVVFKDLGRLNEAMAAYRQALVLKPDFPEAHSNLVHTLHLIPALDAQVIVDEHRRWNQRHCESFVCTSYRYPNDRTPERRLRIGYVSADFRAHSVSFFIEHLLACHDSSQVEVFCYASVVCPDEVTARLRKLVPHWRDICNLTDSQVADLVRRDQIDILVDLAGHTAENRLLVFARKPAPIQVTYLGYVGTTGLGTMDYRFTDAHADPPGTTEHFYTERLIRLPETFACYRPPECSPPVSSLPALARGYVTFGSFHALSKLNEPLLETWAKILLQVPNARLMIVAAGLDQSSPRNRLCEFFAAAGVNASRLAFKGRQSLPDYLALHGEVDVLLDSHPYSGHTIGCAALWMGVPVITLAGDRYSSRMLASVLANLGRSEWVARTPCEYVANAVALANDLNLLTQTRSTLREEMRASPVMDGARFARSVESAYREMWRAWCVVEE